MLQINEDDLRDVLNDIEGFSNLLTVVMGSEYYEHTEDVGVYLALRNSVDYTKDKLVHLIEKAKE